MKKKKDVVVTVERVKGYCAAGLKKGDKFVLEGSLISIEKSDKVCGMGFSNIYPMLFAARLGYSGKDLGYKEWIVQCADPGSPHSDGGTVWFSIKPLKKR